MHTPVNYITTWFYKESKEEASFYPQLGQKGSSSLVHSIYMQIQVPFFVTFKHYNPDAQFIFFTNLNQKELPDYLIRLFHKLNVEVVTLPYTCKPPKDWYPAWQNQFYLYDILKYMDGRMLENDTLLISDADCLCHTSLNTLFDAVRKDGSALYEFITDHQRYYTSPDGRGIPVVLRQGGNKLYHVLWRGVRCLTQRYNQQNKYRLSSTVGIQSGIRETTSVQAE